MRFGIAGAGSIIPDFLEAEHQVPEIEPYAICASHRSEERLQQFAREAAMEHIYYTYDEMLEDPALEAVYIAVPNVLHYEFARKALEHGLHVICEKPFCNTAAELEDLTALAQERHLFLFEAISNQYLPTFLEMRRRLPEIGRVRAVSLNFSQYSSRYDAFLAGTIAPAFDPAKKGGALRDINVYNIHVVTGLFGEPTNAAYYPNIQKGVDTSGVLVLTYPDHVCTLIAAKDCDGMSHIMIEGEQGYLYSPSKANSLDAFCLYERGAGTYPMQSLNLGRPRLYHELRAWADMVNAGDYDLCRKYLEHSLIVQRVIDKAAEGMLQPSGNDTNH